MKRKQSRRELRIERLKLAALVLAVVREIVMLIRELTK